MKKMNLFFICIACVFINSCKDQEAVNALQCDKLTSREEAENLMRETQNNRYTESTIIIENLIGEWGVIGVVPGWVGFEPGQECIKIKIDINTVELEDLNAGTINSTDWELLTFEVNGYSGFYLSTNEDVWNNRIGMEEFSDNIMFGSGRVDDGAIYIYEKLD